MYRPIQHRSLDQAINITIFRAIVPWVFVFALLCLPLAGPVALAQGAGGKGRSRTAEPAGAAGPEKWRPLLRQEEPKGWVWVTQTVDISRQIGGEKEIMTLDGEPLPSLVRKRVTLGLVLDNKGHIATRLIDVTPQSPPKAVTVRSIESRSVEAVFLGMDLVSGICILKAESAELAPAQFYEPDPLPVRSAIQVFGFHPNQRMSLNSAIVLSSPRRNIYAGLIAKATGDFRYQASNPIYHLVTPRLTAVQDGSLVLGPGKSVFGIAIYDGASERGAALVYTIARIRGIAEPIVRSRQSLAYGWFGATGRDVILGPSANTPRQSSDEAGVRIIAVAPDSPAERAGVLPKDIILGINEQRILNYAQLASVLRQLPADSEISVRVKRGAETRTLRSRLVPAPSADPEQQILIFLERLKKMEAELAALGEGQSGRLELAAKVEKMRIFLGAVTVPAPPEVRLRVFYGIEAMPLTGQLMSHFAVTSGMLVTSVVDQSSAGTAGLKAGDIVVRAGGEPVKDLPSLLAGLDRAQSPTVPLTIVRNREEKMVVVAK